MARSCTAATDSTSPAQPRPPELANLISTIDQNYIQEQNSIDGDSKCDVQQPLTYAYLAAGAAAPSSTPADRHIADRRTSSDSAPPNIHDITSCALEPHPAGSSCPFGLREHKATLLTAPSDPRVSRASLPPDYDWRAVVLLLRMAAAAVVWGAAVGAAGALLVWAVGLRLLGMVVLVAELGFAVWYRRRWGCGGPPDARKHPCSAVLLIHVSTGVTAA